MALKKKIEKIEKKESLITDPTTHLETSSLTPEDISDLKKDEDLIPASEDSESSPQSESLPEAKVGKSLAALNNEIKAKMKAEGKSTRVLNSENQKKYALSRTATALEKRGWKKKENGIYELSSHKLKIDPQTLIADVDGYVLPLGKDALKTLDQYVALSSVNSTLSAPV
jgi:hypothetical protein